MLRGRGWWLVLGVLVGLVGLPRVSFASVFQTQEAAYSACLSQQALTANNPIHSDYKCKLGTAGTGGASASCSTGWIGGQYYVDHSDSGNVDAGNNDFWCVPASCDSGAAPDGATDHTYSGYDMATGTHCDGGCETQMHLSYAGKNSSDPDSGGYTVGYWVNTGNRCTAALGASNDSTADTQLPVPPVLTPVQGCDNGKLSCYNPWNDSFCATSESGEVSCVPRKTPPPGGCASGATGSECIGKDGQPVPAPPDPPIQKDTPPDQTNNFTINDGTTTTNYTVNNYSGTSPGPGSSSPPSSSPGGTGTNVTGAGNSGSKGTDANGKCADGSVPTASGCSGTYRDNGCDTPPACYGDAVLCGIAANTHRSACNVASGSSVGGAPDEGDPMDGSGDPSSSSVSSTADLGDTSGLNSGGFGYASTCPLQDGIHFDFLGKSIDVATDSMCTPLSFIYYIVLAFAYFSAAKIMAGVK